MAEKAQEVPLDEVKQDIPRQEAAVLSDPSTNGYAVEGMTPNQILAAYHAAINEHKLSNKASFRIYWKAVLWITVLAFVVFQEQFDTNLTNSFQAFPSFQKRFGYPVPKKPGEYQLHSAQQVALSDVGTAGHLIGFLINGYLVDKIGNRKAILLALFVQLGTTFLLFFAQNFGMIIGGQAIHQAVASFVGGTAPTFAIEIAPLALRPYAPVYVHFLQIFGNLTASGVEQHFSSRKDDWAWRIPYAIQWAFPIPLIVAAFFSPESPWWLVRRGKFDEARKNLRRLHNGEPDDEEMMALMQHTVQLEKKLKFGGKYIDVFRGVNLRRTEIAFMACVSQSLSGFALRSGAYFFEQAGLSTKNSFTLQCAQFALGIIGSMIAIYSLSRMGRRPLYFIGTLGMCFCLAIVGILASLPNQRPGLIWPQGVFMLFHFFFNNLSVGPLSFVLSVEIGSVQLRRKTVAIGRTGYDLVDLVSGTVSPYLINPTAANLKGKSAWVACGFCLLLFVYGYFRIPETKDRNTEEIDILFAERVPARQFKSYVITSEQEFGIKSAPRDHDDAEIAQAVPFNQEKATANLE